MVAGLYSEWLLVRLVNSPKGHIYPEENVIVWYMEGKWYILSWSILYCLTVSDNKHHRYILQPSVMFWPTLASSWWVGKHRKSFVNWRQTACYGESICSPEPSGLRQVDGADLYNTLPSNIACYQREYGFRSSPVVTFKTCGLLIGVDGV